MVVSLCLLVLYVFYVMSDDKKYKIRIRQNWIKFKENCLDYETD